MFSWSYARLSPAGARLFRLLGVHAGPDISVFAAASLAGIPLRSARPVLAELVRANLIGEHSPGRYAVHDLLHAYAAERSDSDPEAQAALTRVLDHYLRTGHAAAVLLYPDRHPVTLPPCDPDAAPERLTDDAAALRWFATEHRVLLAAIDGAAAAGRATHAWQLAWTLTSFLHRRGHWDDWLRCNRTALRAAERQADRTGQAHTHYGLSAAYTMLNRIDDAHAHSLRALELYGGLGDRAGQAQVHLTIGFQLGRRGDYPEALRHTERALDLYRATSRMTGQANALNNVGWYCLQLGKYQDAISHGRAALALQENLGNVAGAAATWDSVGYAHHHLGQHRQAADCYQHALRLYRDAGDRGGEAEALVHVGDTHYAVGDVEPARRAWQRALSRFAELGHPDAVKVRAKLDASTNPHGTP